MKKKTVIGTISKQFRKLEKNIEKYGRDTRKFKKRVKKSPLYRFGMNLSESIDRGIFG